MKTLWSVEYQISIRPYNTYKLSWALIIENPYAGWA
jgi:hypothetical protein